MTTEKNNSNRTTGDQNFFCESLHARVESLNKKYRGEPYRILVGLVLWCATNFIKISFQIIKNKLSKFWNTKHSDEISMILFDFRGGVGDVVIASTYLKELYKHLGGTHRFSICTTQNILSVNGILNRCPWVEQIYSPKKAPDFSNFCAVVVLTRTPRIIYSISESKTVHLPHLNGLLQQYRTFEKKYPNSPPILPRTTR